MTSDEFEAKGFLTRLFIFFSQAKELIDNPNFNAAMDALRSDPT